MPCYRAFRPFLRHKNIGSNFVIIRNHKPEITCFIKGSHQSCDSVGKHSADPGFLPLSMLSLQKLNRNDILMECSVHFLLRDKKILLLSINFHKSKAPCIADKGARKVKRLTASLNIFPTFGQLQLSLLHKLRKNALKLLPVFGLNLHENSKFLFLHRNITRVLHELAYDVFPSIPIHHNNLHKKGILLQECLKS